MTFEKVATRNGEGAHCAVSKLPAAGGTVGVRAGELVAVFRVSWNINIRVPCIVVVRYTSGFTWDTRDAAGA